MTVYNFSESNGTTADSGLGLLPFTPEEANLTNLVTDGSGHLRNTGAFKFYYARSPAGDQSSHGKITIAAGSHPYYTALPVQQGASCRQTNSQLGYMALPEVNGGGTSDICDQIKVNYGSSATPSFLGTIDISASPINMATTALTLEIYVQSPDIKVIVNGTTYTVAGSGGNDASGNPVLTGGVAGLFITNNTGTTSGLGLIDSFDDGSSDAVAPSLTVGPTVTNIASTGFDVTGTPDEGGTAYLIVTAVGASQPADGTFDSSSETASMTASSQFTIHHTGQ